MRKFNKIKVSGFTLVELIITVSILAILMSMAVPSFQKMLERNQVTTTSNDMLASFLLARSEAVTRDENMVVAKLDNKWENGWTVTDASANILLTHRTSHQDLTVVAKGTNTPDSLTYTAQGRTTPALVVGTDYFEITLGDTTRCVNFATTGRPSVGDC